MTLQHVWLYKDLTQCLEIRLVSEEKASSWSQSVIWRSLFCLMLFQTSFIGYSKGEIELLPRTEHQILLINTNIIGLTACVCRIKQCLYKEQYEHINTALWEVNPSNPCWYPKWAVSRRDRQICFVSWYKAVTATRPFSIISGLQVSARLFPWFHLSSASNHDRPVSFRGSDNPPRPAESNRVQLMIRYGLSSPRPHTACPAPNRGVKSFQSGV